MTDARLDLPQGTLDRLIPQARSLEPNDRGRAGIGNVVRTGGHHAL